ncbi:MAG TPA: hypothetical protein VLT33_47910, partial [Labilithrix sp.]|nr:hypothetical protein [Labilithrix sp.]
AYMSPEQVHGEQIDRRTDLFALGVVLWELTTGKRLFRMESDLDTLAKVQECNVPRPSTLIRGYPVDLEKIVMKALAKNRGERFRTARELSRALQSLLMRRGLFIASDEVAAYTQSIFNDRIQKREAHLRWAAEVTSTINVDQLLSKPKLGPEFTNSEVQAQKPVGVRPAAGMPAPITGPMAEPEPSTHQPGRPYPASIPDDLKETGPSLPTQARSFGAANANANAPRSVTAASVPTADPRRSGPPRPAAGAPMQTMQSPAHLPAAPQAPPQEAFEEEHPADGDGPTIQALPPMVDAFAAAGLGPSLRESDPPTLAESMSTSNEGPTMMANPQTRAAMIAASSSDEIATLEPDDFDEEDQDATMVANTRAEPGPLQAPPTFPQVAPAAGRSNPPAPSQSFGQPSQRPPPSRFNQTVGLAQQIPPMLNPVGYPQQMQQPQQGAHLSNGDISFNETLGMQQGMQHGGHISAPPHDPNDYGRPMGNPQQQQQQQHDYVPRSGPHPTGPSGDFIPRVSPRQLPTVNRMGAPTYDNRTMTAQRYKRRPPMWVVAALSCSIALLIAGVVIAIISSTGSPTTPRGASPSTTASAGNVALVSGAGAGPFSSARTAINSVVNQPGSALVPPGAPPSAVTAPQMTAAAPTDTTPTAAPQPATAAAQPAALPPAA